MVERIFQKMIEAEMIFKMLADTTRLRSLVLLTLQGELCVCELSHALGLSQPLVSRHLALLRDNQMVNTRRSGQWMYYDLKPELANWVKSILQTTADANATTSPFVDDLALLKKMPNRPEKLCCN